MKTLLRNLFNTALAATFFLIAGAGGLPAQVGLGAGEQPQPQAPAPAARIGKISIKFVGMANVSEQIVRANMVLREDTDLDEALIDRDIRSLYRTKSEAKRS